jgi:hypothetical protein
VWQRARACDPLNFSNWANMASMQSTMGDFAAAIATAEEGIKMVPHRQIVDGLIYGLIGAGEFDKALAANERLVEDANLRKFRRMRIEAARGDSETLRELRDELAKEAGADNFEVTTLAHLGERDRANQAAAAVDARPLGFLDLADMADSCKCGAPFDLEFTPNFARLVDEAQLMWPPRSSIEWPLKVW